MSKTPKNLNGAVRHESPQSASPVSAPPQPASSPPPPPPSLAPRPSVDVSPPTSPIAAASAESIFVSGSETHSLPGQTTKISLLLQGQSAIVATHLSIPAALRSAVQHASATSRVDFSGSLAKFGTEVDVRIHAQVVPWELASVGEFPLTQLIESLQTNLGLDIRPKTSGRSDATTNTSNVSNVLDETSLPIDLRGEAVNLTLLSISCSSDANKSTGLGVAVLVQCWIKRRVRLSPRRSSCELTGEVQCVLLARYRASPTQTQSPSQGSAPWMLFYEWVSYRDP